MLEVMLRDRFVAGIKSENLQKKLLQEDDDVTLDRVFSIAVSFELAEQNAKELQDGLVAKMDIVPGGNRNNEARRGWQHGPGMQRRETLCFQCGKKKNSHLAPACPHKTKSCFKCKRIGHLSRVCKRGKSVPDCRYAQDELIYSVQGDTDAKINLHVDEYQLCFVVDTGSPVTLIPKTIYEKYWKDGCLKNVHIDFYLKKNTTPVFCKARSLPFSLKKKVENEIDGMVNEGILQPIEYANWAAPIVPVLKKDGSLRICGDFRCTANKAIELDKYPLPSIDEIFSKLSGNTLFSSLDLSRAYLQVRLSEEAKRVVNINTTKGLFAFKRLPYGVAVAPNKFQREMDNLFADMSGVACYIDDILVAGKDHRDHGQKLELVFKRLQEKGLRLNKDKCKFAVNAVEYLGFKIDKKGLHPISSKIEAVVEAPEATNVSQLRSFIGLLMYYSRFIRNIADILAPFYHLLKKNSKWNWTSEHRILFAKCKALLTNESVLAHYDATRKLVLACDASSYGLGVVLSHRNDRKEETPIAFASRTLTEAERRIKDELSCELGCLQWRERVVIPQKLRSLILNDLHEMHLGMVKMKMIARRYFWWPGIDKNIEELARDCRICQESAKDEGRYVKRHINQLRPVIKKEVPEVRDLVLPGTSRYFILPGTSRDHPGLGGQEKTREEAPVVDEELKGAESSAQEDTPEPEPGPAAAAVPVPVRSPRPQRSRRPPEPEPGPAAAAIPVPVRKADGKLGKQEPSLEMLMSLRPKLLRCKDRFLIASDWLIEQLTKADREDEEIEDADIVQVNIFGRRNTTSFSTLYVGLSSQLQALGSLGVTTDKCAAILYPMVESALPEDLFVAWERTRHHHKPDEDGKHKSSEVLLEKLMEFLKHEVEGSERMRLARQPLLSSYPSQFDRDKPPKPKTSVATAASLEVAEGESNNAYKCVFCDGKHLSEQCCKAMSMYLEESGKIIQEKWCWYSNLKPRHISKKCRNVVKCVICSRKHWAIVCPVSKGIKKSDGIEEKSKNTDAFVDMSNRVLCQEVLLQTIMVNIKGENKSKVFRAMLDSGSQSSYVLEQTASEVGLTMLGKKEVVHLLFGGVKSRPQQHKRYRIYISDVDSKYNYNFEVQDCSKICSAMPSAQPAEWMTELRSKGIDLDVYRSNTEIELLLGADVYANLLTGKKIELESGPVTLETKLGWTVSGKALENVQTTESQSSVLSCLVCDATIQDLWRLYVIDEYKKTIDILRRSMYVDNCVASVGSKEDALKFKEESVEIFGAAKMNSREWEIGPSSEEKQVHVLGLFWNLRTDELTCDLRSFAKKMEPGKVTRRKILSAAHSLVDPIGFTCPFTIIPKMLLQESYGVKAGWDTDLSEDISRRINACSNTAFAACAYLRNGFPGSVQVQLLMARSRVAPMKNTTIPRLELVACEIGSRLAVHIKSMMEYEDIPITLWTDSNTALAWIKRDMNWPVFVTGRGLSTILCCDMEDGGRDQLKKEEQFWTQSVEKESIEEVNSELRKAVVTHFNIEKRDMLVKITQFSNYHKIFRMVAYWRRFLDWLQRKRSNKITKGPITMEEMIFAEEKVIRLVQHCSFEGVKDKKFKNLRVYEDESGLLRVKCRFVPVEKVDAHFYPIVMPSNGVTGQLIWSYHRLMCHAGVKSLHTNLREGYWILNSRRTIRNEIRQCACRRRFRAQPCYVEEGSLPKDRVRLGPAFDVTGVDMTGPLHLKGNNKYWIAIFTCATYRAIHLELCTSLTTETFIGAMRRFVFRRGRPSTIYSDNGLNFVGCKNLFSSLDWNKIVEYGSINRISWKFNPPTALEAQFSPEADEVERDSLVTRYRNMQACRDELRARFTKEYLAMLVHHRKAKKSRRIKVGEIVLIGNDQRKRISLPLEKVEEVLPGADGQVRVAR
ncbi:hypothetical protein LAZ67_3005173, partial [Cordylochernes scorpioides]